MKTNIEAITPEIARKLLEGNHGNRPVRESRVVQYAQAMTEGLWKTSHQGVAISPTGRLLDGQHRLHAIVRSGVTVTMQVSRNVPDENFRIIDGGVSRSIADRLPLLSDPVVNKMCVSIVMAYSAAALQKGRPTADDVDEIFLKDDMDKAFTWIATHWVANRKRGVTRANVGAALAVYRHSSPGLAEKFMEQLLTGEGLSAGHPALVLREAALADRLDHSRIDVYWKAMAAIRAHKEGRTLHALHPAGKDLLGNVYRSGIQDHKERGIKAAVTRKKKGKA